MLQHHTVEPGTLGLLKKIMVLPLWMIKAEKPGKSFPKIVNFRLGRCFLSIVTHLPRRARGLMSLRYAHKIG